MLRREVTLPLRGCLCFHPLCQSVAGAFLQRGGTRGLLVHRYNSCRFPAKMCLRLQRARENRARSCGGRNCEIKNSEKGHGTVWSAQPAPGSVTWVGLCLCGLRPCCEAVNKVSLSRASAAPAERVPSRCRPGCSSIQGTLPPPLSGLCHAVAGVRTEGLLPAPSFIPG